MMNDLFCEMQIRLFYISILKDKIRLLSLYNQWWNFTRPYLGLRHPCLWPFSTLSLPYLSQTNVRTKFAGFCSWITEPQRAEVLGVGAAGEEGWLTSAGGQHVAPLPTGQALGPSSPFSHIPRVANKLDHIIKVKLGALSKAVDWVAWVSTGNRCNQNRR